MLRLSEVGVFDEMGKHLGIGFGAKGMPFIGQLLAQFGVVFDDAVVDNGENAGTIGMGMGVGVVRPTMRGPACMSYTQRTAGGTRVVLYFSGKIGNFTGATTQFEIAIGGENGDACGVVAAIFEFAQSFKQYGSNVGALGADVANDTAHEVGYPFYYWERVGSMMTAAAPHDDRKGHHYYMTASQGDACVYSRGRACPYPWPPTFLNPNLVNH